MMRFDMRAPEHGGSTTDLYAAAIEMAAWAETRGCLTAVISEHHASPDGYLPAPLLLATAMAARTTSLPITLAALILPLHDPVELAEQMAVLDIISRGRVSYVFGLGYRDEEFEMFGVPPRQRGRVLDEKLALVLEALKGQPFEHDGRRIWVTPPPASPVRISLGGGSPAAARRAGRLGFDFMAQTDNPAIQEAYVEAATGAGVTPGACMLASPDSPTTVFVADDVDKAWAELGPYLLHDARMYASWNPDPTARTASISHSETVEELRAEQRSHRIFSVEDAKAFLTTNGILPLHPLCGGVPPELAWPYLERVANDVLG